MTKLQYFPLRLFIKLFFQSFPESSMFFALANGSFLTADGTLYAEHPTSNKKTIVGNQEKPTEFPCPPYRLQFLNHDGKEIIVVSSYSKEQQGPFAVDALPRNSVRFTTAQVEAIRSGCNEVMMLSSGEC